MRKSLLTLILSASALGAGCSGSTAYEPNAFVASALSSRGFSPELDRRSIQTAADAVAGWQFSHLEDLSYITRLREDTAQTRGWVQGALYVGAWRWADTSRDAMLERRIQDWALANAYELGPIVTHADDHVVGRVYLEMHRKGRVDDRAIADIRRKFDAILADPPAGSLEFVVTEADPNNSSCQPRWCWSDALFMSPPAWFALSLATGDPRYAAYGDREFWATTDYLYDETEGFWFRDSRFFDRRGPDGEKLFWSRGNGWSFAGLVNILEMLPDDHPSRPRYEALLVRTAQSLKATQQASGFWGSSLLARNGAPESSGTGFFVFGLQRGIDLGLLPAEEYGPVVQRGWSALVSAIGPDGKLGYVQQIGAAPGAVRADETQLYGAGAFLLAASALYAWAER